MLEQKHVHLKMKKECWLFLEKLNISWLLLTKSPVTLRTKIDSISSCKALTIDMIQNEPYHQKPREYDTKASPKHWKERVDREWLCIPQTFIKNTIDVSPHQHFFRNWIVFESQKKFPNQNFFSLFKWRQKTFLEKCRLINRMLF